MAFLYGCYFKLIPSKTLEKFRITVPEVHNYLVKQGFVRMPKFHSPVVGKGKGDGTLFIRDHLDSRYFVPTKIHCCL